MMNYYAFRRKSDGRGARLVSELPTSAGTQMVVDVDGEGPALMQKDAFIDMFVAAEDCDR